MFSRNLLHAALLSTLLLGVTTITFGQLGSAGISGLVTDTNGARNRAPKSVKVIPVEIPITNQIYVQATLNGSEPLWFLIDTGATWSILDVDKAKELNIKSIGQRTLDIGQTYSVTTTFAQNAMLEISGIKVPVPSLAVMPVKFQHDPKIVGVIGSELFKRFVVEFDYRNKTIELFEPKGFQYTGRGETLPIELIEEIPHIVVRFSKRNEEALGAKLLVDTGAAQTLVLYAPFVEKHRLLETTEGTIKLKAGGLGGGSFNYKVRVKSVKLGKLTFENPLISFATTKGNAQRDGIIGNGFLGRFKLIVDYLRRRVVLEPTERFIVPTDFDFFLFEIARRGQDYTISELFLASMTAEAGLKIGDILLAINDRQIADLPLIEIQRVFLMDGGDRVLTVKRGDQLLELKLKTFPIY